MITISAWEAYTNGISAQLHEASADADVWTGADGSVIIDEDGEMFVADYDAFTCEYTLVGTVAEYLADEDLPL